MIAEELRALGLPAGAIVVVHTSYRAVGPVDGGPAALIDALGEAVGRDGTLVMPSMSDDDDIVPAYYGHRARWRAMMRESIAVGVQQFSSDRMVSDYYTRLYRREAVRAVRRAAANE